MEAAEQEFPQYLGPFVTHPPLTLISITPVPGWRLGSGHTGRAVLPVSESLSPCSFIHRSPLSSVSSFITGSFLSVFKHRHVLAILQEINRITGTQFLCVQHFILNLLLHDYFVEPADVFQVDSFVQLIFIYSFPQYLLFSDAEMNNWQLLFSRSLWGRENAPQTSL